MGHAGRVLDALALTLVLSAAPEPGPREFCAEFTRQAKGAKTFAEALRATSAAFPALADATSPFGEHLGHLLAEKSLASPDAFLANWRGDERAAELAPLDCPALEFPAGRSKAEVVQRGGAGPRALLADAGGAWLLSCFITCDLTRFDRSGSKTFSVPAVDSFALGDDAVFLLTDGALLSMPRRGGATKPLLHGLRFARLLVRDGDSLLFVEGPGRVKRVSQRGGAVSLVADVEFLEPPPRAADAGAENLSAAMRSAFSSMESVNGLAVAGGALVVLLQNKLVLVRDGATTVLDDPRPEHQGADDERLVAGASGVLLLTRHGRWLLDLGTRRFSKPDDHRWTAAIAAGEGWLAVDDGSGWPGKRQLVRVGPGGATTVLGPVGATHLLAADAQRVYWVDGWWQQVLALPK